MMTEPKLSILALLASGAIVVLAGGLAVVVELWSQH